MIKVTFLKELILIKEVQQKSVIFAAIVFLDKGFKFQPHICNGCHDVLMMFMNLSTITVSKIYYHCIINKISKSEPVIFLQKADSNEKSETL